MELFDLCPCVFQYKTESYFKGRLFQSGLISASLFNVKKVERKTKMDNITLVSVIKTIVFVCFFVLF